jgi:hypothetical protein
VKVKERADLRRMMIRMFNELNEELKENMQKPHNEYKENKDIKLGKTETTK